MTNGGNSKLQIEFVYERQSLLVLMTFYGTDESFLEFYEMQDDIVATNSGAESIF